ncbi:MAG: hypothetical protein PHU94_04380 [Bacilli bacterium]|nr:hypothetical protein [Bacilli bacterium]MDD4407311.1 hypothetical protein [Bacilli bacterium]
MSHFYFKLLIIFIILNIVNFAFLSSKDKFKKISLVINLLSLLFSIVIIFIMNAHYNSLILKEYNDIIDKKNWFLNTVKDLNIFYIKVTLITTIIFTIIAYKVRYDILYFIIVTTLITLNIILFFYKGTIITKSFIDLSTLSTSLIYYYLNFTIIPLSLKKLK